MLRLQVKAMVRSDGPAGVASHRARERGGECVVSRDLAEKIAAAPATPGVYVFRNAAGQVIYVGKAKSLKNRLKSYTSRSGGLDARKREMVSSAADLSYIVTANELEALALEANLIKQDRPKYNVVLRDDKNYPYLRIDPGERWPHVEVVRRFKKDGALYFGPYIPASGLHETLSLIRKHFGIRLCKYNLAREMRPCVHYQMGRCPAPCANLVPRDQYSRAVAEVIDFLKGKNKGMLERLRSEMRSFSDRQMYEEAARVRDRISAIERNWDSQRVIAPRLGETDAISFHVQDRDVAFVILFVRNGIMTGAKEFLLRNSSDIVPEELVHSFLEMFYSGPVMPASKVLVPVLPADRGNLERWLSAKRGSGVSVRSPRRGLGRDLLRMAESNAGIFLKGQKTVRHEAVIRELKERLGLRALPVRIGAFDVSTIQGTDSVGGYIVWEDGVFLKRFYRAVGISPAARGDDFAAIRESAVRILEQMEQELPDLIVIDGGKGQLEASLRGIAELNLPSAPEVVAVAKDPERVFARWLPEPQSLEDSSPSSLLLRSVRDEVHRFVIGRHRKLRQKRLLTSSLEDVDGVGRRRRIALLRHFGSLEGIRGASVEEIASVAGFNRTLALRVKEFLGS